MFFFFFDLISEFQLIDRLQSKYYL